MLTNANLASLVTKRLNNYDEMEAEIAHLKRRIFALRAGLSFVVGSQEFHETISNSYLTLSQDDIEAHRFENRHSVGPTAKA